MYPSPRPKRARLSHAVAPPLPTEPACAGLRRGPDFSPCHLPLHKGGFWPGACSDVVLSGEILPISSLKSDNRNTAVPRPPCVKGAVTVGDWGIVSGGELGNLRILQQALFTSCPKGTMPPRANLELNWKRNKFWGQRPLPLAGLGTVYAQPQRTPRIPHQTV